MRPRQVLKLSELKLAIEGIPVELVGELSQPPRESHGPPYAGQCPRGILLKELEFRKSKMQYLYVRGCEVQTLCAGRRYDVRRITREK
jgi:hypothetical protein